MKDGALVRLLVWIFGASWRTTLAGIGLAFTFLWPELEAGFDGDPNTHVVWSRVIGSFIVAYFGRTARDRKVSSEQEKTAAITGTAPPDALSKTRPEILPPASLGLIVVAMLVAVYVGGCAETNPIGPTFEQTSDAGTTRLVNQPPGALGIREVGLNWAATGTANVKAVKVGPDGVMQLGSGPATRQVFWNPKSSAFVLSSETDFKVDSATVYGPGGHPLYDVRGFSTLATNPTLAMSDTLAKWGKTLEALSDKELQALQTKMEEQASTVRATLPTVADMLSGIAGMAADVMKARATIPAK